MFYNFINRKYWHLIICFCTVLLIVSSCASMKDGELSVSRNILKQFVGSYKMDPDTIIMVTLEGRQLFISSCPLLGYSVSPDIVKQYDGESILTESELSEMVKSEINMMAQARIDKKYPVYAVSETEFITKTRLPAHIEFFLNTKGEVTHFVVKKRITNIQMPHNQNDEYLSVGGTALKIRPYINNEPWSPFNTVRDI